MSAIFKKWKFLIIGGVVLVILTYTLGPIVEFILKVFQRPAYSHTQFYPHWQRFTNREAGYAVEFPSKPFEYHDSDEIISNLAAISYHQFVSVLESNNCFMVATLSESFTNDFTDEQINFMLDTSVKGALGSDGRLLAKRNITLDSNLGREIEFQRAGNFLKMRFYKVGHKFQQLTVSVPLANQQASQSTNASYFFNSFSLLPK
jgi:hypothetical protein